MSEQGNIHETGYHYFCTSVCHTPRLMLPMKVIINTLQIKSSFLYWAGGHWVCKG